MSPKTETRQALSTPTASHRPLPDDTQTNPTRTLGQKLLAVMRDVAYIQKDKKNAFHGYRYASEAAIKGRLHAALLDHGVLFHNSIVSHQERTVIGEKEKTSTITTLAVEYWFEDAETGDTTKPKTVYGSGVDPLDKGVYKAITGALKYALTGQFLISTGDDPEEEAQDPDPRGRTIDVGPHQRNTREAQEYVRDQKLNDLRKPPEPQLKSTEMAQAFAELREQIGEVRYQQEIDLAGGPPVFHSMNKARQLYKRLALIARQEVA